MNLSLPLLPFPLALLLLLLLLDQSSFYVSGHNWLGNLGRGRPLASTRYPYPKRLSDQPHLQVGPNQVFPMEWAVGHGNNLPLYGHRVFTYIVIFHEADEVKLPATNQEMTRIVNQYVRDAPLYSSHPSFVNLTGDPFWKAYQLHSPTHLLDGRLNFVDFWDSFNATLDKYYERRILPGDPLFIQREPGYLRHCKNTLRFCKVNNPDSQWLYRPNWQRDDVRYEYIHPRFPWIEAVHKFEIGPTETSYTNQYQVARMRIPARKGPGNYRVWYRWGGYLDAMDVNVQPQAVANRYGVPANRTQFSRVDHCQYTNIQDPATVCRLVNRTTMNISHCLSDCARNRQCSQVQVTRVTNLPGSVNMFPNIPTLDWTSPRENVPACSSMVVQKRSEARCPRLQPMCNLAALGAQPDDYLCWGSAFIANSIFEATPAWTIAEEPEDPVYFSTCYERFRDVEFLPYPQSIAEKPSWVAGFSCLSCDFVNRTINLPIEIAPNWERGLINDAEGKCQSCTRMGL